ncbi:DUF2807 domain-containing protein [Ilyomonas limi]|uniref:DUF2807 domain-containing protein n=1 Tax=Ilyomonas limi TaxID=2575867 RepID=A0A4U3L9B8_9BACT|nr:head GIN domain-containing protein [Ilyomonas limi]TKK71985.1 DUF2807 domain-containing protein [Ilyomonas limi]
MKQLLLLLCLAASIPSFAIWDVIKGNGIAKTETRDMSGYTSLACGGPIKVEIGYGSSNTIQLEGDENLLPYIETYVKDGELTIKVKERTSIKPQVPLRVHVSMTTINGLKQSGSGEIKGNGNFTSTQTTAVAVSGSGRINLNFDKFSGMSISMSGSGSVKMEGEVNDDLEVAQSGSGDIDCGHVASQHVNARMSGSGNLRVNASKSLDAQISGSGHIYYTGNASVSTKISGSGKVEKM